MTELLAYETLLIPAGAVTAPVGSLSCMVAEQAEHSGQTIAYYRVHPFLRYHQHEPTATVTQVQMYARMLFARHGAILCGTVSAHRLAGKHRVYTVQSSDVEVGVVAVLQVVP